MADITPQVLSWNSSTPDITEHTPDATQVYKEMNENTTIVFKNDSLADETVTLKNCVQDEWGSVITTQDEVITVGAGKEKAVSGPFLAQHYLNADKELTAVFSTVVDFVTKCYKRGP